MTAQGIYFVMGIAGVVLTVGFAVAAAVYFFRVDIPAVRADLTGRARQVGIAAVSAAGDTDRRERLVAGASPRKGEVFGGALKLRAGQLGAHVGEEVTPPDPLRATGYAATESDDMPDVPSAEPGHEASARNAAVRDEQEGVVMPQATSPDRMKDSAKDLEPEANLVRASLATPAVRLATSIPREGFSVTCSVVEVHSANIIDSAGRLAPLDKGNAAGGKEG